MSYTLTLQCGCSVYVATHPATTEAHTRVIESTGPGCGERRHEVGLRLEIVDLLPDPQYWRQLGAVRAPRPRSGRA